MYESHFGLSGSPFQLNPDPAFYFDSRGHSNALAYLKFGAHQGEGFIVVTGEIGAGKTTLVRTLLEGLDPAQVVAAQIVSTQLESGELLQAILMSFGVASSSNSKAHLIGTLEAFLTSLAAKGRRALLIIDEAQNLKHEAVEELRMLSNFQLGKYGLLQSFLVGQPELRQLLQSKSMEQLRQRVIASCHLGPLQPPETRAYVEHRLRRVGWSGRPEFMPDAFERIHLWTGGVPRKINRLCNRLLLGAFLSNEDVLTSMLVDRTASELKSEIGELAEIAEMPAAPSTPEPVESTPKTLAATPPRAAMRTSSPLAAEPVAAPSEDADFDAPLDTRTRVRLVPGAGNSVAVAESARPSVGGLQVRELSSTAARSDRSFAEGAPQGRVEAKGGLAIVPVLKTVAPAKQEPASAVAEPLEVDWPALPKVKRRTYRTGVLDRPLICLVDSASDFLKAGTLAEVFLKFPSLPHLIAFHPGSESSLTFGDTGANELPMPFVGLHVEGLAEQFALRAREVLEIFDEILTEFNPQAVLAMGNSDAILASSLLANKRGIGFFRVAGGQRRSETGAGRQMNGALIDKISDALYVDRMDSYYTLYQEGIKSDRVLCVGNLVGDMLKLVLPHAPGPAEVLTDAGVATDAADSPLGFLLVTVGTRENIDTSKAVLEIVTLLCDLGRDLPVIWPVGPEILEQIQNADLKEQLREANVTVLALQGYLQLLGLMEKARCLLCGADDSLLDEAMSLRIPSVTLGYDRPTSTLIARSGTLAKERAPGKPLSTVHQELASAASMLDSPAYWDSGTATRIANHLALSLPKGGKVGVARD